MWDCEYLYQHDINLIGIHISQDDSDELSDDSDELSDDSDELSDDSDHNLDSTDVLTRDDIKLD